MDGQFRICFIISINLIIVFTSSKSISFNIIFVSTTIIIHVFLTILVYQFVQDLKLNLFSFQYYLLFSKKSTRNERCLNLNLPRPPCIHALKTALSKGLTSTTTLSFQSLAVNSLSLNSTDVIVRSLSKGRFSNMYANINVQLSC